MTRKQESAKERVTAEELKQLLSEERDLLQTIIEQTVQQVLEAEMDEALQAGKSERSEHRMGYRSGYYSRTLITRVGKIELRVPQDRQGRFRTEVFERRAIQEVLPEAVWQRCYVHFLRNALDYLPRKADDDCLQELRWIYDRRDAQEARRDLAAWLAKWGKRYAKLCVWVEENIEETFSFYRLPRQHHKNLKSTNMLERLMEELKRRTLVVRIFPNAAACLRLVRALAVEIHENWIEAMQYLNMDPLREQKKEALRKLGDAA